jgi:hypothetical protein
MRCLSSRDGVLLAECAVVLLLARLALSLCPFRTLLKIVDRAAASPLSVWRRGPRRIERVRWAVLKASRYVPGTRHCLTQALCAKLLLGSQDRAVHVRIGVAKDEEGRLIAHAWLEAEGMPIFGLTDAEVNRYSALPQLDPALKS